MDASAVPVRLAGKEACEWARRTPQCPHGVPPVGAEARREDHQSATLVFRWFLRILTSNLESRRPTSSLTRVKVSPDSIEAICPPTSLAHVPAIRSQRLVQYLYFSLHHVELKSLFCLFKSAFPNRPSEGEVPAALRTVGNVGRQQKLRSCCFKRLKRLGSHRGMECWTLEMIARQASPRC